MKHEDKIQKFLREQPLWERYNLRKKLNVIFTKKEDCEIPKLGFVPDAFEIDEQGRIVRLLEVDGHSYTDNDKMFLIAAFWYEMDARSWSVELRTVNLFTNATSILTDNDLARHWFSRYDLA
tara:strand:- start:271 stop:636 length:366 start_codon:yes stop_codon:yes gene_type:complete